MSNRIKSYFKGWDAVSENLKRICKETKDEQWLNLGQKKSLLSIAKNIPSNGMLIADEVGMGKTRIAVVLTKAVTEADGRVAILIPAGLGYQWKEELRMGKLNDVPDPLRSLNNYFEEKYTRVFEEPILLITHRFSNWRHSENSNNVRYALLAEVYAYLRKENKRLPRNYNDWSNYNRSEFIKTKAQEIVNAIPKNKNHFIRKKVSSLNDIKWSQDLFWIGSNSESTKEELRNHFKTCVGLGLGVFDLIIIDEAHKNRGAESGLSKLLDDIICRDQHHRVVGLTATPVELELHDWLTTLRRIGIDEDELEIENSIKEYSAVVGKVRESWKFSADDRLKFKSIARKFEKSLQHYLIRRDKREDSSVIEFQKKSNLPYSQYRDEKEISIDIDQSDFQMSWRRAICGAEALSFVASKNEDPWAKRLRLTVANGHAISTWLDLSAASTIDDQEDSESISALLKDNNDDNKSHSFKRKERIEFWKKKIGRAVPKSQSNLFFHPAILATIRCIEEDYTKKGDKVLVFGKFTRPMKALVSLLNAREMVRRLDEGKPWPQYTLKRDEELAAEAALQQLNGRLRKKWDINEIKKALKKNENRIEASRRKFRKNFIQNLKKALHQKNFNESSILFQLLEVIEANPKKYEDVFLNLSRACYELVFGIDLIQEENLDVYLLLEKCRELVQTTIDVDQEDENSMKDLEIEEIKEILANLNERLKEEFGTQTARFVRFMFGETKHHSRLLMQLAFNRPGSFPYVLVAQSKVGREGLNLHKACKAVIMFHPEWNPAVAEQQIGRVDRLGSLWSEMIEQFSGNPEDIPRIEIRPIIFRNTYDEQNWNVLHERWDDLRAQLHGIIIPDRYLEDASPEDKEIINDLNTNAPNFKP